MTATVANRGPGPMLKFQAWCEECNDGVNSSARKANAWANSHNYTHHGIEPETEKP